jgi:hypothetical protein
MKAPRSHPSPDSRGVSIFWERNAPGVPIPPDLLKHADGDFRQNEIVESNDDGRLGERVNQCDIEQFRQPISRLDSAGLVSRFVRTPERRRVTACSGRSLVDPTGGYADGGPVFLSPQAQGRAVAAHAQYRSILPTPRDMSVRRLRIPFPSTSVCSGRRLLPSVGAPPALRCRTSISRTSPAGRRLLITEPIDDGESQRGLRMRCPYGIGRLSVPCPSSSHLRLVRDS